MCGRAFGWASRSKPPLPSFEVRLTAPEIGDWLAGNTGHSRFHHAGSPARPGPHVAVLALAHGNEIAGAIVLDRLLRAGRGAETRPADLRLHQPRRRSRASIRAIPRLSRFVDEDLNRLWDRAVLDGPRHSSELERAREIRPVIDSADVVLDLHSMLWPSEPLTLCGATAKGRALARGIGVPPLVVADQGHASGKRIIDYERFAAPETPFVANLVEAGQHWQPATVDTMLACVAGLLRHLDMVQHPALPAPAQASPQRFAEVTTTVTASTSGFAFVQPWHGGEIVARRNTLIALDGGSEIRTPYDSCMLVMPSLRPSRGHTAVRLARFIG